MGTVDRRPYLSATMLDQPILDEMADNLEFAIDMVADIESPTGTIHASDKNKYVGEVFYRALCQFPEISRTMGDWLSPALEFSTLELPLSNVAGRFSSLLPGGADFANWVGKTVDVRLGLAEVEASYSSIYRGRVTDVGGLDRDRAKIIVRTRDDLDRFGVSFPRTGLTQTVFADLDDSLVGTILPVCYGDFTVGPLQTAAGIGDTSSVPAFPLNGKAAGVLAGSTNLQFIITENDNRFLDPSTVWCKRGDLWALVPSANVVSIVANRTFEVVQGFSIDASPYVYKPGDSFFVRIRGKDVGASYQDNIVWQARDLLMTQGGASSGDFSSAWATLRDKPSPAGSDLATIKSRVWVQDPENVVTYALSMFEQVRCEMFIDRSLTLDLSTLHLEDFVPSPTFKVRQWDLAEGTLKPKLDDRNVWNRVRGQYAFDPALKQLARQTPTFVNTAAVTQIGKRISKQIEFPNLYVESDVTAQLDGMLRLATGNPELVEASLNPRAVLLDLGDFVRVDLSMGGLTFANTPMMVRRIGYDPKGRVPVLLWNMQMTPFPGYTPGYAGTVGGSTAIITQE